MTTDYTKFARGFHRTRNVAWPCVARFLDSLSTDSTVFENGCGNGRNLICAQNLGYKVSGSDICQSFVDICRESGLDVFKHDILESVPQNHIGTYDAVLSIAVLHHIRGEEQRRTALQNCYDMVKPGGNLMITVWSVEKGDSRKPRELVAGENLIPWKGIDGTVIQQRYYYVFDEGMFRDYISAFVESQPIKPTVEIEWEQQNWIAIIQRPLEI